MRFSLLLPLILACSHPVLVLGVDETGTGGTGVMVEPTPPSALSIEPDRWDFSSTVFGGRMLKIFTIRNTGVVALTTPTLSLGDPNVGFAVQKPCSGALGPGESCDIQIEFTIDEPGKVSTILEASTSSGDRASAILDGRRAGMAWSVTSYEFGTSGASSREQTFMLTGKALSRPTGAIVIATENVALEILRDSCSGQTLSDGSSCSVTVRPWPTQLQFQDGYLIATAERAGSARLNVAVRNVIGR
jgi:hypothetical protein